MPKIYNFFFRKPFIDSSQPEVSEYQLSAPPLDCFEHTERYNKIEKAMQLHLGSGSLGFPISLSEIHNLRFVKREHVSGAYYEGVALVIGLHAHHFQPIIDRRSYANRNSTIMPSPNYNALQWIDFGHKPEIHMVDPNADYQLFKCAVKFVHKFRRINFSKGPKAHKQLQNLIEDDEHPHIAWIALRRLALKSV